MISILQGGIAHASGSGDVDRPRVAIEPRLRATTQSDIRIDSNLVLLPVNVTDPQNRMVTGLGSGDFRVFDGQREQTVMHLSNDDAPVSIGVVFDASGSMASKMSKAREAVAEFLRNANPADEFFLVNFSDRAELTVPLTENAGDIESRLTFADAHGRTALLDGVYLALNYLKQAKNPRRALLVISDGGENDSRYTQSELRKTLRESDAWIYAIGIYAPGQAVLPEEERGGPKLLTDMTEQTGGHHVAVQRLSDLPDAAGQIGRELRNQYVLAYSPTNLERDGKYHRVQVKLVGRRALRVSSRPGYFAPAP
jgi:VWFA-related protein